MKRIFVSSPFKSDIERNSKKAQRYARYVYQKGHLPIAPHLYFPQFLKETSVEERMSGIQFGLELLADCKELWVFGDDISEGMYLELTEAKRLGILIRYFTETDGTFVESEVSA